MNSRFTNMQAYFQRCADARLTRQGDIWRNLKTGKILEIIKILDDYRVEVKHESGRKTLKKYHYLAGEYEIVRV